LRGDKLLLVRGCESEDVSPRGNENGDAERARVNAGMDSERDGVCWKTLPLFGPPGEVFTTPLGPLIFPVLTAAVLLLADEEAAAGPFTLLKLCTN